MDINDINRLLEKSERFEIEVYKKPPPRMSANHVQFIGSPRKHPYQTNKVVLIMDPFSDRVSYCEFRLADVDAMEELPHLVSRDGTSLPMVRIWVKKGSPATRSVPFIVE